MKKNKFAIFALLILIPAITALAFINTDIFEKAGVDMSLVKNGWTWETFLSVCETIRQYFDSTGKGSSYVVRAVAAF